MLQNAYFVAKIGADTAENEQHSAEILPTDALWLASGPQQHPGGPAHPRGLGFLVRPGGRGEST